MPRLTIITITYNAEHFLERTLVSIDRAWKNLNDTSFLEYLIIDGASKDKTLEIADRYAHLITRLTSEPDDGLYDAMNKGLAQATGDYLWFLNAGDEVHDVTILRELKNSFTTLADIYYSDTLLVREDGSPIGLRSEMTPHNLPAKITWKDLRLGMKICHQSLIVKKQIAPVYNTTNLSADLDWEIQSFQRAKDVVPLNFVLCRYLIGGLSVQQHRRSLIDRFQVLKKHFGLIPTIGDHVQMFWRGYRFIKKNGKYW
jgi:glycosyltransferase involved in cell wall biosynthesis